MEHTTRRPARGSIGEHIGMRIRRRRHILQMSQRELGKRVGVSFQQIQKYETAGRGLTVERMWSIAKALEQQPAHFFEGFDERPI